jgi:hypothetical protein
MLTIFHVDSMSYTIITVIQYNVTHSYSKPKEVNWWRGLKKKEGIDIERKRVYQ